MADPKPTPRRQLETELREVKESLAVLRREAIESRGTMKRLVDVLRDLHTTNEGLRLELQYLRTVRERTQREEEFARIAGSQSIAPNHDKED